MRAVSRGKGTAPEANMSVTPNGGNVPSSENRKVTVPDLLQRKSQAAGSQNKKITSLTAYDYPTARLVDEADVDVVLVGDSLGMVVLGYESTLPLTLEESLHHTKAVRRGVRRALVVADMPYGSYHGEMGESLHNAMRFVKEVRLDAARPLLLSEGARASEVALRVGYESPAHFTRDFKRRFGASPVRYARRLR